jgi:hypothetical protein
LLYGDPCDPQRRKQFEHDLRHVPGNERFFRARDRFIAVTGKVVVPEDVGEEGF